MQEGICIRMQQGDTPPPKTPARKKSINRPVLCGEAIEIQSPLPGRLVPPVSTIDKVDKLDKPLSTMDSVRCSP